MEKTSTITSKRQLTIPSCLFRAAGLREGQKVLVSHKDGSIIIKPAIDVVEKLAGSVKVPLRFRVMQIDRIIERAKKEYHEGRV